MTILTIEDFSDKQGEAFQLLLDEGGALELTLKRVKADTDRSLAGRPPFSLFFEGTRGHLCPQATYRFRHPSGWEADIFIVPVGGNPDGTFVYQAVFN